MTKELWEVARDIYWDSELKGNPWVVVTDAVIAAYLKSCKDTVDPYAELKAAAADPTKQIRYYFAPDGEWLAWVNSPYPWDFTLNPKYYEIRDKPKKVDRTSRRIYRGPMKCAL